MHNDSKGNFKTQQNEFSSEGKYRILFTDIDSTLLNKERQMTPAVKEQIKRISNMNIPVVLVSSRMPKAMKHLQDEAGISAPLICCNGSLIVENYDEKGNIKIILSETIPADVVKSVYRGAKEAGVHIGLYRNDEWYVEALDYWANREILNTRTKPEIIVMDDIFSSGLGAKADMHKIMCMGNKQNIDQLVDYINKNNPGVLNLYRSKDTYLEITANRVSKGSAIKFLHEKMDIDVSETIAVGDNYNDVEMIKYAGLGIAMGNAKEEVKAVADEITLSNNEDGIAEVIKKYF